MKLHRDSRIVRWAWMMTPNSRIPNWTSLCEVFWRSVLVTPMQVLVLLAASPILLPAWIWMCYIDPPLLAWRDRRDQRRYERMKAKTAPVVKPVDAPSAWRVLWAGAKAVKGRVCPIVEITR